MTEDDAYAQAFNEVNNGIITDGLWAKAVSLNDGEDMKTSSIYIRLRADSIYYNEKGHGARPSFCNICLVLLSPYGKIPRWIFALSAMLSSLLIVPFCLAVDSANYYDEIGYSIFLSPVCIIGVWIFFCSSIKRIRDIGLSPYYIVMYLIPFVGIIWLLVFFFGHSGDSGEPCY